MAWMEKDGHMIQAKVNEDPEGISGYSVTLWDDNESRAAVTIKTDSDIHNLHKAMEDLAVRLGQEE